MLVNPEEAIQHIQLSLRWVLEIAVIPIEVRSTAHRSSLLGANQTSPPHRVAPFHLFVFVEEMEKVEKTLVLVS